ncbi:hypothetical protein C4D60_Mb07t13800 [Musa balbisiana]|uniref:Uncharacterized protein n=1 Tax=Musa balbisiana TaxID=52838 RepID=A0A4S8JH29_MUSBA|nr:hypothetical protein C4D60_Mb07t13800 [Musa balbisiana]
MNSTQELGEWWTQEIVTARDDVRLLASVVLVMNTNYFAQVASEPSLAMALQQAGLSISQKSCPKKNCSDLE